LTSRRLYTALQQGVVDGQENPPAPSWTSSLEVQKYMTETRHGHIHYILAFNKKWFDAQPNANQEILVQAMKEAGRWERKAIEAHDVEAMKRIREASVQIIELTPQAREQFRQLSLKVHEKFVDKVKTTAAVCDQRSGGPEVMGGKIIRGKRYRTAFGSSTLGWGHYNARRRGGRDPRHGAEVVIVLAGAISLCQPPWQGRRDRRPGLVAHIIGPWLSGGDPIPV
jgi:hypothetical protein